MRTTDDAPTRGSTDIHQDTTTATQATPAIPMGFAAPAVTTAFDHDGKGGGQAQQA